jgi:hypothetical protein
MLTPALRGSAARVLLIEIANSEISNQQLKECNE